MFDILNVFNKLCPTLPKLKLIILIRESKDACDIINQSKLQLSAIIIDFWWKIIIHNIYMKAFWVFHRPVFQSLFSSVQWTVFSEFLHLCLFQNLIKQNYY